MGVLPETDGVAQHLVCERVALVEGVAMLWDPLRLCDCDADVDCEGVPRETVLDGVPTECDGVCVADAVPTDLVTLREYDRLRLGVTDGMKVTVPCERE